MTGDVRETFAPYQVPVTASDYGSLSQTLLPDRSRAVVVNLGDNQAPHVDAGSTQSVAIEEVAYLHGEVKDEKDPSIEWRLVSGVGTVNFGNAASLDTTPSFSSVGSYLLRLVATAKVNFSAAG